MRIGLCESWTIKKAERRRIDAFKLWCWRRLLRVPWTASRSNQSILKEISPGCSLEGLMLKLKFQYFGHLMWRADSFEKTDAGKDWGQEEKGTTEDKMVGWCHWLDRHGFGWTPGVCDGQGGLACSSPCRSQKVRHDWATELNTFEIVILQPSYISYRISQVALVVKNPPANAGDIRDVGSIPGLGRSPGEGNGNPLQ